MRHHPRPSWAQILHTNHREPAVRQYFSEVTALCSSVCRLNEPFLLADFSGVLEVNYLHKLLCSDGFRRVGVYALHACLRVRVDRPLNLYAVSHWCSLGLGAFDPVRGASRNGGRARRLSQRTTPSFGRREPQQGGARRQRTRRQSRGRPRRRLRGWTP